MAFIDALKESKNLIEQAQNIYIVPSKTREESIACALALFYTLKELKKNVNLALTDLPDRLKFLTPSLDYISGPKDFVISIPKSRADISQVGYEKNDNDFKIYIKTEKGNIRKSDISFCFAEARPDLIITMGVKSMIDLKDSDVFSNKDSARVPILNIDNQKENENFGRINLVETERPLSELVFNFISSVGDKLIRKETFTALLAGLVATQNKSILPNVMKTSADLIERGADGKEILENFYKNNLNN